MLIYTSLSPKRSADDVQRACVKSWIDHGHNVVCVQSYGDEILDLPRSVEVLRVKPTMAGHQPRPYVGLDAILDAFIARGDAQCAIINGDIEIDDQTGLIDKSGNRLVCLNRYDHDGIKSQAKMFTSGFDMFILTRENALAVPRSMFVIGQTFWDYWLPWSCAQAGHQLTTIGAPVIYHRRHPLNYAHHDWARTVQHFLWLTRRPLNTVPIRASTDVHKYLMNKIYEQ